MKPRTRLAALLCATFVGALGCSSKGEATPFDLDDTSGGGKAKNDAGANGGDGGSGENGGENGRSDGGTAGGDGGVQGGFTYQPTPSGCVTDVTTGSRTYACNGLTVEAAIPNMFATCPPAGCGLILALHGDTGNGALIDQHLALRARAAPRGFLVLAPSGPAIGTIGGTTYPGSTWSPANDAAVVAIVKTFVEVFKVDPKRVHATGFSRGGHMTWRLGCDQSNLFASIAPGGSGNASRYALSEGIEPTCFQTGRYPARPIPFLEMMGQTDSPVPYASMVAIKDAALAHYGTTANVSTIATGAGFTRYRAEKPGAPTVEWLDHTYETDPASSAASAKGHCIPGSTVPANAPQYNYACKGPNGFDWGAEVLAFFEAHPMP